MVKRRLGISRNWRFGQLLILAAMTVWAWTSAGAAQPAPAPVPQQAMGMAAKSVAKRTAAKTNAAPSKSESQDSTQAQAGSAEGGRRDPFLLPKEATGGDAAAAAMEESGGGPLPPGKRGLLISQLRLEGVVRQGSSKPMIAVVTNSTNRAYFLRENDEVFNGVVSKITPDSIYFTESVRTAGGQSSTRQVVKKLGSGPGENR